MEPIKTIKTEPSCTNGEHGRGNCQDEGQLSEEFEIEKMPREALEIKLGIGNQDDKTEITLKEVEKNEYRARVSRDSEGNTLLMRCSASGRVDNLSVLLQCGIVDVNAKNNSGQTAADIALYKKDFACLLKLLQADSLYPQKLDLRSLPENDPESKQLREFIEEREQFHTYVHSGDLKKVEEGMRKMKSSLYLGLENRSALFCAAHHLRLEVFVYLDCQNARLIPGEREKVKFDEVHNEERRKIAQRYYASTKESHIKSILTRTKAVKDFTPDLERVVKALYKHLDQNEFTSLIMKVLEHEDVGVVFDFEKEVKDRIFPIDCSGYILGLAETSTLTVYIGGKESTSKDNEYKVCGTLAHELCHITMCIMYENDGKPYGIMAEDKKNEFDKIVREIKGRGKHLDEVDDKVKHFGKSLMDKRTKYKFVEVVGMLRSRRKILNDKVKELEHCGRSLMEEDIKVELDEELEIVRSAQKILDDAAEKAVNCAESLMEEGIKIKFDEVVETLHSRRKNLDDLVERVVHCGKSLMEQGIKNKFDEVVRILCSRRKNLDDVFESFEHCGESLMEEDTEINFDEVEGMLSSRVENLDDVFKKVINCSGSLMDEGIKMKFDEVVEMLRSRREYLDGLVERAEHFGESLLDECTIIKFDEVATMLRSTTKNLDDVVERVEHCGKLLTNESTNIKFVEVVRMLRSRRNNLDDVFQKVVNCSRSLMDEGTGITFDEEVRMLRIRREMIDVVERVFGYEESFWHCEMIVRVPHILAMHGKEGHYFLREEYRELYDFYEKNVVRDSRECLKRNLYTKSIISLKNLQKNVGYLRELTLKYETLEIKNKIETSDEFLNGNFNKWILATSNTVLGCLTVHQHLRRKCELQFSSRCMFFQLRIFEKRKDEILDGVRFTDCGYLVLVAKDEIVDFEELSECFNELRDKKIIVVVDENCSISPPGWKRKVVKYDWTDLSEGFTKFIMKKCVDFEGDSVKLSYLIDDELAPKVIHSNVLSLLINEDKIKIGKINHMESVGYHEEYFVKRNFTFETLKESVFKEDLGSTRLFVTGIGKKDMQKLKCEEEILTVDTKEDRILDGKSVILVKNAALAYEIFDEVRLPSMHWLHYDRGVFHLRKSMGNENGIAEFVEIKRLIREDLIENSEGRNVVIVADNPGSGKTTALTDMLRKLKKTHPRVWLLRVNCGEFSHEGEKLLRSTVANLKNNSFTLKSATDFLVKILRISDPLEESFLKALLELKKANYVKFYFDGFDEIRKTYQGIILKLLRVLKEKTTSQIFITTRLKDKEVLEKEMNTFSFRIEKVPYTERVKFLSNYWKYKLKCPESADSEEACIRVVKKIRLKSERILGAPSRSFTSVHGRVISLAESGQDSGRESLKALRSKIDEIDFTEYAREVLEKIRSAIKSRADPESEVSQSAGSVVPIRRSSGKVRNEDERESLTETLLGLYMLADIVYDDDFKTEIESNEFFLYSKFVEKKIRIYLENKCNVTHQNIYETLEDLFLGEHQAIAVCAIQPKIIELINLPPNERVRSYIDDIGLVVKTPEITFLHRTFIDFFFCEWIFKNKDDDEIKLMFLEEILVEHEYTLVRKFFKQKFQLSQCTFDFNDNFVKMLNIKKIFSIFTKNSDVLESAYVLKGLLRNIERLHSKESVTNVVKEVAITMLRNEYSDVRFQNIFQTLELCLCNESLLKVFDATDYSKHAVLLNAVECYSSETVENILLVLGNALQKEEFKKYLMISNIWDNSMLHIAAVHKTENEFEKFLQFFDKHLGEEGTIELLKQEDHDGETVLHKATINDDAEVFTKILNYLNKKLEKSHIINYLTKKMRDGRTILHMSVATGNTLKVLQVIQPFFTENFFQFLEESDKDGEHFLHAVVNWSEHKTLNQIMFYLKESVGDDSFVKLLKACGRNGNCIWHLAANNTDHRVFRTVLNMENKPENVLELIQKTNDAGDTVLHHLTKNHPKSLSVLRNSLDKVTFEKLITMRNNNMETILQASARNRNCTALFEILDLYNYEVRKVLLLGVSALGNTVLHIAAENFNKECFDKALEKISSILTDEDFVKLVVKTNNMGDTFLHIICAKCKTDIFDGAFSRMKTILSKFLTKANNLGETILHAAAKSNDNDNLIKAIGFIKSFLDGQLFCEFVERGDINGDTFLHTAMSHSTNVAIDKIVDLIKIDSTENWLKELLLKQNNKGNHILLMATKNKLIKNFQVVFEVASNYCDRNLLELKNIDEENIFQAIAENITEKSLPYFKKILTKFDDETLRRWFTNVNKKGETILHALARNQDRNAFVQLFETLKKRLPLIFRESNEFLTKTNNLGNTFLHVAANHQLPTIYNGKMITFWNEWNTLQFADHLKKCNKMGKTPFQILSESNDVASFLEMNPEKVRLNSYTLENLLSGVDSNGNTLLHNSARNRSAGNTVQLLHAAKAVDKRRFLELINKTNNKGETFLHILISWKHIHVVNDVLAFLKGHGWLSKLLTMRNYDGDHLLHLAAENTFPDVLDKVLEEAKLCLGSEKFFNDMVESCNENGDTVLHKVAESSDGLVFDEHLTYLKKHVTEKTLRNLFTKVNAKGNTVLHTSSRSKNGEAVAKALTNIASEHTLFELLTRTNKRGSTFLHVAMESHFMKVFRGEPRTLDDMLRDKTIVDFLEKSNKKGELLSEILPEESTELSRICESIGDLISSELFGQFKCDVRYRRKCSLRDTALMETFYETLRALRRKLNRGDFSEFLNGDANGDTFFHIAVAHTDIACIETILRNLENFYTELNLKEFFSRQNNEGNHILHMAAKNKRPQVFQYILRIASTHFGESLKDYASVTNGNRENVYDLIARVSNLTDLNYHFNILKQYFDDEPLQVVKNKKALLEEPIHKNK